MTTTTAVTLGGGSAINVELENVARFAIDEHNNRENGTVVFVRVDQAADPLVVGRLHHLTVEAIDAGEKKLYEAKVWVKPWSNFKQLQEFKHAGDAHASPSSTTSDLVVNKVVQPLPGTGRSSYAKKRRAKRMGSDYDSFARWKTKAATHALKTIQQRSNSLVLYQFKEIVHANAEVVEDYARIELVLIVKRGEEEEKLKVEDTP
ncbi:hypothetical protein Goshw_020456 [Gossypium schwendimanii]|uniref:Cysteine proteinase inhibitor n=1 Tax=Gossypium schwendimanii TaxID=34291 RepID=A0A7J9MCW4_GOSSC|nr:hypothetical protein [Gossypium schwendimanii]